MSWTIHLQGFKNKDLFKFERSIVWDIFKSKAVVTREGWGLVYDGQIGGILRLDDDELVGGCSIRRPSDNSVRDLYAAARIVPSAIHVDAAFFVADPAFLAGFPDWLFETLPKPPKVVLSADELFQSLAET